MSENISVVVVLGGHAILYEPPDSEQPSIKREIPAEIILPEITSHVPSEKQGNKRRSVWGGRTFRFNIKNFLPGKSFSLRRFSIVEAAFLLILALLASRGLGVVRQTIFNAMFGTGPEANAYYAAARLPDTLFNLIAGGALIHAFIPVFLSHEKNHGKQDAWRLASLVFNVLLVILTLFVFASEYFAPAFVSTLIVPGYSHSEQVLTTSLTRIILFQPLILGLGTVITAILNGKRQFLLPALSIAVYNIGLIGGLVVARLDPAVGIYGPTYGILIAAVLQGAVQVPALLKQGFRYTFTWDIRSPGLREVMSLLGPNALAVAIGSVGFLVDTAFVSYLPDRASLSAIHNAQLLYALPEALMAQAIGLALLPHLALQAAEGRFVRMRQTALKVMGAAIALTVPSALLLWLLGKPMIRLLFQHGAFTAHASTLTYLALVGYAVGLPGIIGGELLANGFFALKDTRTPLFTNTLALGIRYGLILLLLHTFQGLYLILAIPLALSGSATIEAIVMAVILLFRLKNKVRRDVGMKRLVQLRLYKMRQAQTQAVDGMIGEQETVQ